MTVCHCVKYRYENWRQCSGNVMSFLTTFTLVNNENLICTYDALMIESWRSSFMSWVLFCFVTNYMNNLFKILKQDILNGWKFVVLWTFWASLVGNPFEWEMYRKANIYISWKICCTTLFLCLIRENFWNRAVFVSPIYEIQILHRNIS